MKQRLPPVAVLLGIAGLIPFVACTLGTISNDPGTSDRALTALIGYGAVILAFLGGIHWGFVLSPAVANETGSTRIPRDAEPVGPARTRPGTTTRLVLGVVPSLVGWLALLTPLVLSRDIALAVLIIGFLATAAAETQGARSGLIAHAYLWMRWPLTVVVTGLLTTALTLRLLGVLIKI